MIKRSSTTAFIYLLLAAFMVFKWLPSHAHLSTQHEHGGEQHQHNVEAHAHQPAVFHADAIDTDHAQIEDAGVVELDHDQNLQKLKKFDHPAVPVTHIEYPPFVHASGIFLARQHNHRSRFVYQHPAQPRAPPRFS